MSGLKIDLLVIDPQNDFVDAPNKPGSLAVAGAYQDCLRLAAFIDRVGSKLNDIHVTMDTHRLFDIAHPAWWKNPKTGEHPAPFTMIKPEDIGFDKLWVPVVPYPKDYIQAGLDAKGYTEKLAQGGRYPLVVWPPHCLIGSWGNNINPEVFEALQKWEAKNTAVIDFVTKGSNPYTEHYSAVQAEVPDPFDPGTALNTRLINMLQDCDTVVIAGEALSHCVANTVRDIAKNFGDANVKKMVLLEDCSSNVTGFEQFGIDFVKEMTAKGMKTVKSTDFL